VVRAVVDTNVLISGATGSTVPGQVVDAWRREKYILVTSPQLVSEVERVLHYPNIMSQFSFSEKSISDFIGTLTTRGYVTSGTLSLNVLENDPDDNWVIAAAVEGAADYIVTGDKKHLLSLGSYQNISIINPKEFLAKINS
jgi:putative PIN family toxin of toxin-antitoxin system